MQVTKNVKMQGLDKSPVDYGEDKVNLRRYCTDELLGLHYNCCLILYTSLKMLVWHHCALPLGH